jgi:drug/metabolite transporter (DMT)-like permease
VIFSHPAEHDAYWASFVLRVSSFCAIGCVVLARRSPLGVDRRALAVIALVGALDILANLAYSVSTTLQLLSISAVLSSLFPVVTVALARVHLGERVTRVQVTGSLLTMAGVLAVAGG